MSSRGYPSTNSLSRAASYAWFMRETIEGALEEFVAIDRKRDSAPTFAADDDEESVDVRTMLEWPPKPRTPLTSENEHDGDPVVAADE